MSEPRMIRRTHFPSIGMYATLAFIALAIGGCKQVRNLAWLGGGKGNPSNPPVIITGGTIHGSAGGWSPDTNQPPLTEYLALSPNSQFIYTVNVTGAPLQKTDSQGWVINFYDLNSDGSTNQTPAAMLCSDETCGHSSVDPANYVYFRARSGSNIEEYTAAELHFHDLSQGCGDNYPTSRSEGVCDGLPQIGIITGGSGGTETRYTCGPAENPMHCDVSIGAPPSSPPSHN
jgi:hypothetical protein